MIRPKGKLSPPEGTTGNVCTLLPLLAFTTCRAITPLRQARLRLIQNSSHCKQASVRVQHKPSIFRGKPQYWGTNEASLQSVKRRLLPIRPHKVAALPCQGHERFRPVPQSPSQIAIISYKANKLSYSFYFIWCMPVPHRRLLHWVTRQPSPAHNVTQKNHFRLHKCTFLCLQL